MTLWLALLLRVNPEGPLVKPVSRATMWDGRTDDTAEVGGLYVVGITRPADPTEAGMALQRCCAC